jgi:hypothetical protein
VDDKPTAGINEGSLHPGVVRGVPCVPVSVPIAISYRA